MTVDELIARWLAQERLTIRPSAVLFRLVRREEGPPTETEERAALSGASAVLEEPRATLLAANVANGSSLLAVVAGGGAGVRHSTHSFLPWRTREVALVDHAPVEPIPAVSLAPTAVTAFWLQLPQAQLRDNFLRLAGGTWFLGRRGLGSTLYMRDDYRSMLQELQHMFASSTRKVVVSGNPGIGKSWFGFVVLHHIATTEPDARIVWEMTRKRRRFLFHGGMVLQGDLDAFGDVLDDWSGACVRARRSCARSFSARGADGYARVTPSGRALFHRRFLVDEVSQGGPDDAEAKMVVFSAPRQENYNAFLKATGATIRFMPVWRWDEILACHALLYANDPTRPLDEVSAVYEHWGGIPRYVLEKLRDKAAQNSLAQAISRSDLSKLAYAVDEVDAAEQLSHRVLHIITERPYTDVKIAFGSANIAHRVLELLEERNARSVAVFLGNTAKDPGVAGFRGILFEAHAHRMLRAGGEFRVRRLDGSAADAWLTVAPAAETRLLKKEEDLAACPPAAYCTALTQNFPAVDAAKPPRQLFQMTVSAQHDVSHTGLTDVLAQLPDEPQYDLYFVVPGDIYAAFPLQAYMEKERVVTKLGARVQRVVQWALCIPLPGVPSAAAVSLPGPAPPADGAAVRPAARARGKPRKQPGAQEVPVVRQAAKKAPPAAASAVAGARALPRAHVNRGHIARHAPPLRYVTARRLRVAPAASCALLH